MKRKDIKLKARGNYRLATEWMRKKRVYTKQDLVEFYMYTLGKDYRAASGSAIVLLSPRLVSNNGDPRGSASNPWGHVAYNEKIKKRVCPVTGKNEKQRYMFHVRDVPLEKKHHTYYRRKLEQEKEMTAIRTSVDGVKTKSRIGVS